MNIHNLDADLRVLAEKKTVLGQLDYANEAYDRIEEELHQLEDKFQENYGVYMEEVFSDIHDQYCPDNDVLLPIAYLANNYIITDNNVDVGLSEGVLIEVENFPDQKARLVLVPSPTRIFLQIDGQDRQEVWKLDSGE